MGAMSKVRGSRAREWAIWFAAAGSLLFSALGSSALAQVSVPGTSNPYLAGMPAGSACCSGDSAPAQSPAQVTGITLTPGTSLTFTATGGVDFAGGIPSTGPDGGFVFTTASSDGISGATWPVDALVGVFLDNTQPDSSPAPGNLDFSTGAGTAFTTLAPALKQAFFIGDGLTGTGTGTVQTFVIPAGATRLFLGTSDGVGWFNNSGSFSVTVAAAAAPPPVALATPVPTLSTWMLVVLSLALAALSVLALRRV